MRHLRAPELVGSKAAFVGASLLLHAVFFGWVLTHQNEDNFSEEKFMVVSLSMPSQSGRSGATEKQSRNTRSEGEGSTHASSSSGNSEDNGKGDSENSAGRTSEATVDTKSFRPSPEYPVAARRRNVEGKVVLKVNVLPDGTVESVGVDRSSGSNLLDESARKAVSQWRFLPARRGGVAIRSVVTVPIVFQLSDARR